MPVNHIDKNLLLLGLFFNGDIKIQRKRIFLTKKKVKNYIYRYNCEVLFFFFNRKSKLITKKLVHKAINRTISHQSYATQKYSHYQIIKILLYCMNNKFFCNGLKIYKRTLVLQQLCVSRRYYNKKSLVRVCMWVTCAI